MQSALLSCGFRTRWFGNFFRYSVSLVRHSDHVEHLSDGFNRRIEALALHSDDSLRHSEAIYDGRKLLRSGVNMLRSGVEYLRSDVTMLQSGVGYLWSAVTILRSAGFFVH